MRLTASERRERRKERKAKKKAARLERTRIIGTQINPNSDAFLESYEWRRVRMEVIKKYGAKCQCCGATPKDGVRINVDHIKPRKLFPMLALDKNNLQVLCDLCNHGKGNWDFTDWRETEMDADAVSHIKSIS